MAQPVVAFFLGLLFAVGLGVSGMTRPSKVIGFLDVTGAWDPSLMFVMAGAIAVYATAYPFIMHRPKPLAAARFVVPAKGSIDRPLVIGAVVFGIGWGLGGYCPGPGLVAAATGGVGALVFVAAMVVGMLIQGVIQRAGGQKNAD